MHNLFVTRLSFHYFPRDVEAGDLVENFLVSAIASILVIRLFLAITGYPQLGGENFHIAHMLVGGFLMFLALIGLLVFLNKETKHIASYVGGIGFGMFLDELGKFITNDNDYFYQPTIALIYVIFVLLFLGARAIEKYFKPNKQEYAINALEMIKQVIMHDLDVLEKRKAYRFLKKSDQDNPIVNLLTQALDKISTSPLSVPNIFHKIRSVAKEKYIQLIHASKFVKAIVSFFVVASIFNVIQALLSLQNTESFAQWGQLIFSVISGVLVIVGVYFLLHKGSRKKAYEIFKYAVLVSIFLTQFFRFLEEELGAITGLIIGLLILNVLQYLIYEEKLLTKKEKAK
ncbi:hypothetical protein A2714_04850 [Candidatus Woesebacteria bacterium RIFCSPHIGHO2_01_FULL_38_9]|uniref:Uncharacterized protein n=2 Tax=Candidatus Woeseibacteriota TaxID=1752722 RepID=A0A1F7Y1E3_9BACT|nr:MAG: hypothetical protein A2714_04850 [Candidatus Woesebacteria bacterium RIFCSPHIGHO2_01_FULL_38_9]OGM58874.1 MAG: hypothetical protein A3A75_06450 [Candidatus Woesebacteria bacterium RIFCSPLOWO2_01_FULL_39_10]